MVKNVEFIDRQEEMKRLNRMFQKGNGGFAVLYGRRRIGKSHLLMRWCKEVNGLYTVGDTSSAALQRQTLSIAIAQRFPEFDAVVYPTWRALLNALSLRARAENWHGPVIFDEFPYLAASDSTLPGVFQAWIDAEMNHSGILVVISGSSQHMMQGLTLANDSPLYGRAQEIMHLAPIAAGYISTALKLSSSTAAIKAYSIWGGVPRYWQSAEEYGDALDDCIDDLVLNPLGLYHEEPNFLLQMETPNAIGLRPYLDTIGFGVHRISEIASRMLQPATALARPMNRLVELGLVNKEIPFGENAHNTKKSIYSISDPFCHFWFKVFAPRRTLFENCGKQERIILWKKYADGIFSHQWEQLARKYVHLAMTPKSPQNGEDFWLSAGRWWKENHPEWDIVSTNLKGDTALLGEVKWSEKPFTQREVNQLAQDLTTREQPPGLPRKKRFALVLPEIAEDIEVPDGVCLLTAEDILTATLEK